eukprot:238728-Pelagomonas_calceolata.AAC.1
MHPSRLMVKGVAGTSAFQTRVAYMKVACIRRAKTKSLDVMSFFCVGPPDPPTPKPPLQCRNPNKKGLLTPCGPHPCASGTDSESCTQTPFILCAPKGCQSTGLQGIGLQPENLADRLL